jgi:predicted nucleotidyltransferase
MVGGELEPINDIKSEKHWKWRRHIADLIAEKLGDSKKAFDKYGVKALYIFGSTKNASAGPASDIDLLIHFVGDDRQKELLLAWLEGWSLCLSEMNFQKTGYKADGLLDIHIITDEDISNKTSFAVKIGATTDAARLLNLK